MAELLEFKLTEKIKGDIGPDKKIYVVVKKDSDNYRGLYYADNDEDIRDILIEENCQDWDDPTEVEYSTRYIDQEFGYYEIGVLIPFKQ